jgi:hypothetical protein
MPEGSTLGPKAATRRHGRARNQTLMPCSRKEIEVTGQRSASRERDAAAMAEQRKLLPDAASREGGELREREERLGAQGARLMRARVREPRERDRRAAASA